MKYDFTATKALCATRNLQFNEEFATRADAALSAVSATQLQVDTASALWVEAVCQTWNPKNYTWKQRILVALYFLGCFKSHRPNG